MEALLDDVMKTKDEFYFHHYNPPGIPVPVPPFVYVVFRGNNFRSHLRAPQTIDFDAIQSAVKLGTGEVVTIHQLGREPWNTKDATKDKQNGRKIS